MLFQCQYWQGKTVRQPESNQVISSRWDSETVTYNVLVQDETQSNSRLLKEETIKSRNILYQFYIFHPKPGSSQLGAFSAPLPQLPHTVGQSHNTALFGSTKTECYLTSTRPPLLHTNPFILISPTPSFSFTLPSPSSSLFHFPPREKQGIGGGQIKCLSEKSWIWSWRTWVLYFDFNID